MGVLHELGKSRRFSGSIRIVGKSKTSAPSARRAELNVLACRRVRVTTIRLPKSGRCSNQFSESRKRTTSPKIATAGAVKPEAAALPAMSLSVPCMVRCCPVVPHRTRGRAWPQSAAGEQFMAIR
jgi:hypothetical protein